MVAHPALLLLADARFPAGGHVHSGGVEAALGDGRISSIADLEAFVIGRLHASGFVDATISAGTVVRLAPGTDPGSILAALDAEADARQPVAVLRDSSRRLGRQMLRTASACWPGPMLTAVGEVHPSGPHQSVALGAVALTAGLDVHDAATLSLHHAVATPTQAALRLGGLDPVGIAALVAGLGALVADLAARATDGAADRLDDWPSWTGPAVEIAATHHAADPARLFAT